MSRQERLLELYKNGDTKARNELVMSVYYLIRLKCGNNDDLFQTVYMMLLKNVHKWDPSRGTLGTFVGQVYRTARARLLCTSSIVYVPLSAFGPTAPTRLSELKDVAQNATEELSRDNTPVLDRRVTTVEMDEAEQTMLKKQAFEDVRKQLGWRDREVLEGVIAGKTLAEIGGLIGVTKERVRQLRLRIEKLVLRRYETINGCSVGRTG